MSHISHFHPPTLAVALYAQFLMYVCFLSFSLSSVSLFRKICYPIAVTWRRIGAQRGGKKLRFRN